MDTSRRAVVAVPEPVASAAGSAPAALYPWGQVVAGDGVDVDLDRHDDPNAGFVYVDNTVRAWRVNED